MTSDKGKIENDFWYKEVQELLGSLMPDREEYISIYGRLLVRPTALFLSFNLNPNCPLKVNSFALRADNNGEEENIGTALYRANSIFDHSCRPNATTIFSGKKLYIKSLISMASLELDKFFISYLDQSLCRESRRAKLSSTWYFLCGCDACSDPGTDLGKHSARCPDPACQGFVPVSVNSWTWAGCVNCGLELSREERFRYQETFTMVREVVDDNGGEYQCKTRTRPVYYPGH